MLICGESKLLKLNCDKALNQLEWQPTLSFNETVNFTSLWYSNYYSANFDVNTSSKQIDNYINIAKKKDIKWTQ